VKAREEKRSTMGLTLDMSTLRPPDTTGFLGIGDAGMAGVGRRGFGECWAFLKALRTKLTSRLNLAVIR
jgi:hypothetical protein